MSRYTKHKQNTPGSFSQPEFRCKSSHLTLHTHLLKTHHCQSITPEQGYPANSIHILVLNTTYTKRSECICTRENRNPIYQPPFPVGLPSEANVYKQENSNPNLPTSSSYKSPTKAKTVNNILPSKPIAHLPIRPPGPDTRFYSRHHQ